MSDEAKVRPASAKALAWPMFDRIVAEGLDGTGEYTSPWVREESGALRYAPDYGTLERLLGVPLYLQAATTTGVPALALDVWLAYELRRAGFSPDSVWPRATHPRILPGPIVALLDALPRAQAHALRERLTKNGNVRGVTAASANILGKNYSKQVDVIMADWSTGPELMISTKRMDSSYGKKRPEPGGGVLRRRQEPPSPAPPSLPSVFAFGLRNDVFEKEKDVAEWLFDLLGKLGREDDAYHGTCVILMEYGADVPPPADAGVADQDGIVPAGPDVGPGDEEAPIDLSDVELDLPLG
ncbi:hypothetical protein JS562_54930, partial [Agrobacterium sp. S2]|nr:hypothetical protein [Agrobacterium sp. S2]